MMKIFLTGATGFIGGHVAASLNEMGCRTTCLVRKSNVLSNMPNVSLIKSDLQSMCDRETAYNMVKGHDYVIHCAAIRGEQRLPWADYYQVNVEATRSLLEAAVKAGVKRFVFLSSVGVLGTRPRQLPADEESPYEPDSNYHLSKMLAEQQVLEFSQRGLHTVVIRPSITYGPDDNGFFLRVARIANKGIFPIIKNGSNLIHLTYIDGLVKAIISVLEAPVIPGSVYIIADAEPITFKSFIEMVADGLNRRVRYLNIPSSTITMLGARLYDALVMPVKKGSPLTISTKILAMPWYYKCSKAVLEMDYHPFDTREQVPRTMEWLRSNGMIND